MFGFRATGWHATHPTIDLTATAVPSGSASDLLLRTVLWCARFGGRLHTAGHVEHHVREHLLLRREGRGAFVWEFEIGCLGGATW